MNSDVAGEGKGSTLPFRKWPGTRYQRRYSTAVDTRAETKKLEAHAHCGTQFCVHRQTNPNSSADTRDEYLTIEEM